MSGRIGIRRSGGKRRSPSNVPSFTQFPISRQGLQDIAQFLIAGMVLFGAMALLARRRGRDPRRMLISIGVMGGLTVLSYVLAFTVSPNIPTPPVPFTARCTTIPVPD